LYLIQFDFIFKKVSGGYMSSNNPSKDQGRQDQNKKFPDKQDQNKKDRSWDHGMDKGVNKKIDPSHEGKR